MSRTTDIWSRRRAGVAAEAEAEQLRRQQEEQAGALAELEQRDDADILQELDLPDPDEMGRGDDFSAFMDAAVPARLRNRALRQLWRSNPVLANVDNLVDYGDDYTAPAGLIQAVRTTYEVGKGLLAHLEHAEHVKAEQPKPEMQSDPEGDPTDSKTVALMEDPEPPADAEALADHTENPAERPQETPANKRRMRFEFAS